jgi:hypothetical protein
MKEQKVLVTGNESASIVQEEVNNLLEEGWFIVSVTAQHIAMGGTYPIRGGYLIVFERTIKS